MQAVMNEPSHIQVRDTNGAAVNMALAFSRIIRHCVRELDVISSVERVSLKMKYCTFCTTCCVHYVVLENKH